MRESHVLKQFLDRALRSMTGFPMLPAALLAALVREFDVKIAANCHNEDVSLAFFPDMWLSGCSWARSPPSHRVLIGARNASSVSREALTSDFVWILQSSASIPALPLRLDSNVLTFDENALVEWYKVSVHTTNVPERPILTAISGEERPTEVDPHIGAGCRGGFSSKIRPRPALNLAAESGLVRGSSARFLSSLESDLSTRGGRGGGREDELHGISARGGHGHHAHYVILCFRSCWS